MEGKGLELITVLISVVGLSALVVLVEEAGLELGSMLASDVVPIGVAGPDDVDVLVVVIGIGVLLMKFESEPVIDTKKLTLPSGAAKKASLVLLTEYTVGGVLADGLALALV